ncbi:PfkB family carbohydrate kinase [Gulosibacter sp. 10]|uniref:PfkB family carbohydrate kinase n=1 Tax=Gulosibacter sp. 10 TaxID=1255570 RepID=UPI00097EB99B|nr:PfkB family carbohydrate kinase [Gulosibacter sp. 10]SJM67871.1 Hydroxymethylpyrimidine phosphate kinase ThiD [Gulosibacter sp. 10]
MTTPPVTYVIAGSEATGGAGCQADLRTLQQLGVYGACTLTCIVSFDPKDGWNHRFVPVDAQVIRDQAEATLADWSPASVKIGMLGAVPTIEAVRDILTEAKLPNVVLDPVLICKGQEPGAALDIDTALRTEVLPLADVLTPNKVEAQILSGIDSLESVSDFGEAAKRIAEHGPGAVLVKGGVDTPGDHAVDVLWDGTELVEFSRPKVGEHRVSGAGDTLATGISAGLALGQDLHTAVEHAKEFVTAGIGRAMAGNTPFDVVWQGRAA